MEVPELARSVKKVAGYCWMTAVELQVTEVKAMRGDESNPWGKVDIT
jgi:hypothetical protein